MALGSVRMIALRIGRYIFLKPHKSCKIQKSGFEQKHTFLRFQFDMTHHCFLSFVCSSHVLFSLRILDLKPCRRWLLWPECLEVGGWTWTAVVEILQWLDCYCSNTCLHLYKRWYGHIYACICMKQKDHGKNALGSLLCINAENIQMCKPESPTLLRNSLMFF